MHQAQHFIRPTLKRDVEMRHESPALSTIFNKFVIKQIRLNAAYTITMYALHLVKGLNQINKTLMSCFAKIAYINSGKNNFLATLSCGILSLFNK